MAGERGTSAAPFGRAGVRRALETGSSIESLAAAHCVHAGLMYLIATGAPVDSSDGRAPEDDVVGLLSGAQRLTNPPEVAHDAREAVARFIRSRVAADPSLQLVPDGAMPAEPARGAADGRRRTKPAQRPRK